MRPLPRLLVFTTFVLGVGCTDSVLEPDAASDPEAAFHSGADPVHAVSVLNWNIYVGADLDAVIAALVSTQTDDDLPALLAAIDVLERTAFPVRAEAIADVIGRERPDIIGLQEVWTIDIDLSALGLPVDIDLDFLMLLQAALAARGLVYDVAVQVTNTVAAPTPGILAVDHDVILANPARVAITSTGGQRFSVNLGVVAPGVDIARGWVFATGSVGGQMITFMNTHLESGTAFSTLRQVQAVELMAIVDGASPVIVMGDFNDAPGSSMYQVVTEAGFVDTWAALRPGVEGLTCCHDPDLSNKAATFDQRIDYIFTRGFGRGAKDVRGRIAIVGESSADRIPRRTRSLWPSDHAGLAARFHGPPPLITMR